VRFRLYALKRERKKDPEYDDGIDDDGSSAASTA
jgi:hypothetical protein